MGDLIESPKNSSSSSYEEETEPSIEWCLENGYKIPKWLLKCNIKCPYVKGNIFEGKHGPINYSVVGDPSANLVLTFHGYNATHTTFSIYQSVLSKNGFRVIAFDLYGHGLSGHPKYRVFGDTFSPKYYVEQADEVINHLGYAGRPLSLIGMSMGACLAAAYCEKHPDLVEKMVLISPAGLIPKKPKRVVFLRYIQCCIPCMPCCVSKCCFSKCISTPKSTLQDESGIEFCETKETDNCISVEASDVKTELNPMVNRMLWSLFVTRNAIASLMGIVNRMPLWTSSELYRKVGSLGKSTLIIFGNSDTLTPPECADELSRLFTNSHTIIFPDSDHLVSFKKPLEVVSSCLAFLGIPTQEKILHYTRWLPFDSKGKYILKCDRELGESEDVEDANVTPVKQEETFKTMVTLDEKPKTVSKRPFKIFSNALDLPHDDSLTNLAISGEYAKRKVPLVVVKQFEDSDL
ncbi:hydrolase [Theileria orientalis strain Shintoku]|uniref:Hydrolase n=1 Tax=Theileria orientalis strain Shintoku TaxID=869250 RepID=J4DPA7_THEOR|nr:hydrolase [Theileria orientalis strain Shintoku]PVC51015.1 hydrolase [Theileria orientalis]BAM40374.1 hydrolase [Theileria orientalis strain Shintoku]|eukprot:XP_009690675.1 hydrolase [Theileria orientalis strain Shintoku]